MKERGSRSRTTGKRGAVAPLAVSHDHTPVARWAALAAAVVLADVDIATVDDWATLVRLRPRLLCRRCRAAAAWRELLPDKDWQLLKCLA